MRWLAGAALGAAVMMISGPALALSCMVPNFADTFNRLHDAPERYVMAVGMLSPRGELPLSAPGEEASAPYDLKGRLIGVTGDVMVTIPLTVQTRCLAVWCGAFPVMEHPVAMFLERDGTDYTLTVGPCPGDLHSSPTEAQVDALRRCLAQGVCGDAEQAAFDPRR